MEPGFYWATYPDGSWSVVEVYDLAGVDERYVRFIGSDQDCSLSTFAHERHAFGPRITPPEGPR
jgi:hypothetical protein